VIIHHEIFEESSKQISLGRQRSGNTNQGIDAKHEAQIDVRPPAKVIASSVGPRAPLPFVRCVTIVNFPKIIIVL
jgi:hypothetical protein